MFKVETDFRRGSGTREELQQRLEEIEAKVMRQQVPLAYAAELYCLRQHIQMVRSLLSAENLPPQPSDVAAVSDCR